MESKAEPLANSSFEAFSPSRLLSHRTAQTPARQPLSMTAPFHSSFCVLVTSLAWSQWLAPLRILARFCTLPHTRSSHYTVLALMAACLPQSLINHHSMEWFTLLLFKYTIPLHHAYLRLWCVSRLHRFHTLKSRVGGTILLEC